MSPASLTHEGGLCNGICTPQDEQIVKFHLWNERIVQVKSRAQLGVAPWAAQKKLARKFHIARVESALKTADVTGKSGTRRLNQLLTSTTEKVFKTSDPGNVIDAPLFQSLRPQRRW